MAKKFIILLNLLLAIFIVSCYQKRRDSYCVDNKSQQIANYNGRKRDSLNDTINLNKPFSKGDTIFAKIISIIDGDTYDAITDRKIQFRIRMEGIDAPEKGMPFFRKSMSYLKSLTVDSTYVMIVVTSIDQYKRIIAYTYLIDGRELSHEMVKAGFAWHYVEYNKEESLAQLELESQQQKLGLWADKNPIPPWEYRKLKREGKLQKKE